MKKDYKHQIPYNGDWKKLTGPLPMKMTNDYLFRALLQADEKTLKAIIISVLRLKNEDVQSVLVTNPIKLGEGIDDKEFHLDVNVLMNNAAIINLEMQVVHEPDWKDRSLVYICRSFDNLSHGDQYDAVPYVTQISFTDFSPNPEKPAFCSCYKWINEQDPEDFYSDKMTIINVDLTNIGMATEEDRKNGIDLWAGIFKSKTWEDLKMIAEKNKDVDQAASSIWFLSEDNRIREQIWRRDLNEARYQARERAFKKLQDENVNLKDENVNLKDEVVDLKDENVNLKDEIVNLKDKVVELMQQLDLLRQNT